MRPTNRHINNLTLKYKKEKRNIALRLGEFSKNKELSDRDIFAELCFCLFTPGSKAVSCDIALGKLKENNLLFKSGKEKIAKTVRGLVRFHNNKSGYLIEARGLFKKGGSFNIKSYIKGDPFTAREWLVKNVKGLGYKEASHFLRNIGYGKDLAILDTHILKNLKKFKLISKIPESINRRRYIELESRLRDFSKRVKIPMDALDLLFWSEETGFIFK